MRIESDNLWPVTKFSVRPAGPDDACFYCGAKLGQQHELGCVIRERTIVVDVTIRLVRRVIESWSPDEVECGMNHTRWCAINILPEIDKLAKHAKGCICDFFTGLYVREATAEDEETFGVRVEQKPQKPGQHSDADQD